MKRISKNYYCLFSLFLSLCSCSLAIHQEVSFPITEGIEYHHIQSDTAGPLTNISILTIDLNNPKISVCVATAHNGLERTSSIVERNRAIAGINAGFFNFTPKGPVGLLMTDGKMISAPLSNKPPRAAVGITSTHHAVFDRVELKDSKLIGINTTDWSSVVEAVGGVSMLVRNGHPFVTVLEEQGGVSFSTTTHPRTAVGVTKDNKFLFVTVDGRQPEVSNGISLDNLANLMIRLGVVDAMNLDGGGSTTLDIFDAIVNFPSDKDSAGNPGRERTVANSIIVKSKIQNSNVK